ncbi:MAG TPA: hypothetical protein VFV99_13260 [Kofleriaceae bacterium]|nr:hypothetical protein [Kofleriaceae bacterium]
MRIALVLALLAGCTQPRSKTCVDICSRESDCITATKADIPFDEKECVSACEVLRADQQNLAKVESHRECVMKNASCKDVLECP